MSNRATLVACTIASICHYSLCVETPRAIASLLSAVEIEDVKRDRFGLRSPEYFAYAKRFTTLLRPTHASLVHGISALNCLSSKNSPEWLSYDTSSSFSVTPSEYCCQTFAEQACSDPRMSFEKATAVVNNRIGGLGGSANMFLYEKCMSDNCSGRCSESEGSDESCKSCSSICQRSCLANLQVVCLRRVCGQNLMTVAEKAISRDPKNNNFSLHEQTAEIVSKKLNIGKNDLRDIENSQAIQFVLSNLLADATVPLCTDAKLVAADRTAGIFVNKAGTTYSESLLKCTKDILKPDRISRILSDPTILGNSQECTIVATSPRNHVKLANDRAFAQVEVMTDLRDQVR